MGIPHIIFCLMPLVMTSLGGSLGEIKGSPRSFVHSSRLVSSTIVDLRPHLQRNSTQTTSGTLQKEPPCHVSSRRQLVEGWLSQEWPTNAWTYTNREQGNREDHMIEVDRYLPYTWHFPATEIRKSWDNPAVNRDRLKSINFSVGWNSGYPNSYWPIRSDCVSLCECFFLEKGMVL